MPMAPQQIQGFPPQGMPIMGQPGVPGQVQGPPPGSPFYHGQMQVCLYVGVSCVISVSLLRCIVNFLRNQPNLAFFFFFCYSLLTASYV